MENVNKVVVKELIEELRKHHGSTLKPASLSEIATIYGTSRQNLANWMKDTPERTKLHDFIEKARKDLEWDESKAYKKVIKKK